MTKILLQVYYLCLATVLYLNGKIFFTVSPSEAEFVMFAAPFASILSYPLSFPLLFLMGLTIALVCAHKPIWQLRVASSAVFLVLLSIKFSYGMITHSEHIWLISSLIICFISPYQNLTEFRNFTTLRLMQSAPLSFYFISGLWKIRNLGKYDWQETALEHHASAMAQGSEPWGYFYESIVTVFPWLPAVGLGVVLVFQLSCIVPIITLRYFRLWGVGAVFFHLVTGIVLGIWFVPTAFGTIIVLILFENFLILEKDRLKLKNYLPS